MKILFVGVMREYQKLLPEYIRSFNTFHLEIPWYYAEFGGNDVVVSTVDYSGGDEFFSSGGRFRNLLEQEAAKEEKPDVVVHWRKWFQEWWDRFPEAVHTMNTCDHSYSEEWIERTIEAYKKNRLHDILCFRTWHKENLFNELKGKISKERLLTDLTLGVDTRIYSPSVDKDPYQMLWASDPGRGLGQAIELVTKLFRRDNKFKLHVCYPDYVPQSFKIPHPALVWHGNVQNGPKLWDLFNSTGVLPYTSSFKEPSSRAHRQAMAAASMVFYPPNMGSPSELIQNDQTGVVAPIGIWVDSILKNIEDGSWKRLGDNARQYAISENWEVNALRFNEVFSKIREEKK